jgi:hypothetical protein
LVELWCAFKKQLASVSSGVDHYPHSLKSEFDNNSGTKLLVRKLLVHVFQSNPPMQLPNKEAKKCNLLPGKNAQLQGIKLVHHLLLQ